MSAVDLALDVPRFSAPALCAEVGGDEWHPEKGGSVRGAKAICARCEARVECLNYALDHHLDQAWDGVWGGTSPRERRAMRRVSTKPTIVRHPSAQPPVTPRHDRPFTPAEFRDATRLLSNLGMSVTEIANALGVPTAQVRAA